MCVFLKMWRGVIFGLICAVYGSSETNNTTLPQLTFTPLEEWLLSPLFSLLNLVLGKL
jgi:hypothetical protein